MEERVPVIIYFILFFFLENTWKVRPRGLYVKFLEILHKALL